MARVSLLLLIFFAVCACDRAALELLPSENGLAAPHDAATPAEDHRVVQSRFDAGRLGFPGTFGECTSDSDCGGRRRRCDVHMRRCVECLAPNDCMSPLVCDVTTERCAIACQSDSDCARSAQTRCDTARHICVACTSDDQCVDPAPKCDTSTGECVECLDNSQCSPPWRLCAPVRNECVECLSDQNCALGEFCSGSRCYARQGTAPSPSGSSFSLSP